VKDESPVVLAEQLCRFYLLKHVEVCDSYSKRPVDCDVEPY